MGKHTVRLDIDGVVPQCKRQRLTESALPLKSGDIRIDAVTRQGSIIDVIKMVLGCDPSTAYSYLNRVTTRFPAIQFGKIRINGKGKLTPVADGANLIHVARCLPGKRARQYCGQVCDELADRLGVQNAVDIEQVDGKVEKSACTAESVLSLESGSMRIDAATQQGSIIDVIKMVLGCGPSTAYSYLNRVITRFPDIQFGKIRINGKGKLTPVADGANLIHVARCLPGKRARQYCGQVCDELADRLGVQNAVDVEQIDGKVGKSTVRMDGQSHKWSIIDVLKVVVGCDSSSAYTYFRRVIYDVGREKIQHMRINGKGKMTPVADVKTMMRVLHFVFGGAASIFQGLSENDMNVFLSRRERVMYFPCAVEGCGEVFPTALQLANHAEIHSIDGQIRRKKQEHRVITKLKEWGYDADVEVTINAKRGGCVKTDNRYYSRLDFVILQCTSHILILEVDEDQHRWYNLKCELTRMTDVHAALVLSGYNLPVHWVRYSPCGKYFVGREQRFRLRVHREEILHKHVEAVCTGSVIPQGQQSIHYLFYDRASDARPPSILDDQDFPGHMKQYVTYT